MHNLPHARCRSSSPLCNTFSRYYISLMSRICRILLCSIRFWCSIYTVPFERMMNLLTRCHYQALPIHPIRDLYQHCKQCCWHAVPFDPLYCKKEKRKKRLHNQQFIHHFIPPAMNRGPVGKAWHQCLEFQPPTELYGNMWLKYVFVVVFWSMLLSKEPQAVSLQSS